MRLKRKWNSSKKTGWLKKHIRNHKVSHMKETMNIKWKKEESTTNIKQSVKETTRSMLHKWHWIRIIRWHTCWDIRCYKQQDFDKDLENSVLTNNSTTDQQPEFFIWKPVPLGAGENKTRSIKTMTKTFPNNKKTLKKTKRKQKTYKKRNQYQLTTKTITMRRIDIVNLNIWTCQIRRCLSAKEAFLQEVWNLLP